MPHKILIRAPNHLGDCVMALPMINQTHEAYPGSKVTVMSPAPLADLFQPNPAVDEVIPIPSQYVHGWVAVFKVRDLISAGEFDTGFILPPSFGAASAFKLAGVKERIGYIADGRRLLLTKPLPLPAPLNSSHRAETYFNILRRASGQELEFTKPKLYLSEEDMKLGESLLAEMGMAPGTAFIAIAHRAVAPSRRWGTNNYASLVKYVIAKHNLRVVLVGVADDHADGDQIVAAGGLGQVVNLAGKTTLRQAAAVLCQARLFIGNDSGPAHLAAAVGAPLVVLSGADDPAETSPISPRKQVIRREELDCIGCVKNICPLRGLEAMRCMNLISVESVASVVSQMLG